MPKRDLERIREILLAAEDVPIDPEDEFSAGFIDLMDDQKIGDGYQLLLMRDAGFIEGRDVEQGLFRVTSAGHDYLDAIRDSGIWAKTKSSVAATGGSAALEIIKALALGFAKKKIAEHSGIEL